MKIDNLGFIVLAVSMIAILVTAVRHNLFRDIDDMSKTLQISGHNIQYQLFPDRSKPLISADKEMGLRQIYPQFFNNFTKEDWLEFWDIIYGTHPLIEFKNERLPMAERNLYINEIQDTLVSRYPRGFSGLDQENWRMFWKQIFSVSPGMQALLEEDKQKERSDRRLDRKMQKDTGEISTTIKGVKDEIEE